MFTSKRTERQQCWDSRDLYYACLDAAAVVTPGKEGSKCKAERKGFEKNCAKSWVSFAVLILHSSSTNLIKLLAYV